MSEGRLRFAFVIQTPRDQQSAVYIGYQSLAHALERLGHSVTILAPSDFPSASRLSGRWTPFAYPVSIASWFRAHRHEFDLVMFHSYAGWIATSVTRSQPPTLVMFHGVEPLYHRELLEETEREGRRLSWRYRFLQEGFMPVALTIGCRTASAVACLNRAEAAQLKARRWAVDPIVLAHGVPPEFFVHTRPRRPLQTLLFVGQWLPMKGIRYLKEAASALLANDTATRLVCAGTLAAEDQVKSEFPATMRERVVVHPRVDQNALAELYCEADVFIFPSLYEGFSRAIVEAMASRLPIVCTAVGVAADALRHEQNALIVPKHDAPALISAVLRLQSDAALADRLAGAASHAARDYALEVVTQRTITAIVAAAGRDR